MSGAIHQLVDHTLLLESHLEMCSGSLPQLSADNVQQQAEREPTRNVEKYHT